MHLLACTCFCFTGNNRTCLDWVSRCKIALGAALGIACIHEGGRGGGSDGGCMYVHGNIKSSNVLLNSCMEVGISDFGLLQLLANSPVASRIVGYQAPEVAQTGELTPQSDVYSFGVVSFVCLMLQSIICFLCNLPIPVQQFQLELFLFWIAVVTTSKCG